MKEDSAMVWFVVNRFCWVEMGGLWDNQKKNITIEENNAIENCMETR